MQPVWSASGSEAPRRFRPATPRGSRNPAHVLKSGVAASLCHRTPNERTVPMKASKPTRIRYCVIAFAIVLAVIQYIDRVCISQAMPEIARDLKLTDAQKGAIFSAFGLAYALFEIPTGWLGDKIGAKKVIMRVVLWWSFFTAATGWAWNYFSMVVARFLFGA